jgi:hypothetical protein
MKVPDGYIPEELSHQNLTGRQIIRQAKRICEAPFFKAIAGHPYYVQPDWFDSPRRLDKDAGDTGFCNMPAVSWSLCRV